MTVRILLVVKTSMLFRFLKIALLKQYKANSRNRYVHLFAFTIRLPIMVFISNINAFYSFFLLLSFPHKKNRFEVNQTVFFNIINFTSD
jgi:hypothetical protein